MMHFKIKAFKLTTGPPILFINMPVLGTKKVGVFTCSSTERLNSLFSRSLTWLNPDEGPLELTGGEQREDTRWMLFSLGPRCTNAAHWIVYHLFMRRLMQLNQALCIKLFMSSVCLSLCGNICKPFHTRMIQSNRLFFLCFSWFH